MKPTPPVFAYLPAFVLLGISSVQAQWSGLGVGAATGNDLALSTNWTGGTINGNLSTINTVGTHNLVLSGNISVTTLNFDNAASSNTVALTSGGNGTGYTTGGTTVTISAPTGTRRRAPQPPPRRPKTSRVERSRRSPSTIKGPVITGRRCPTSSSPATEPVRSRGSAEICRQARRSLPSTAIPSE